MKTHEEYNLKLPTTGVVTSGFGYRLLNGQKQFHNGIDVANKQGTPVVSPAFGTVIKSGFDTLNGVFVVIQHETMVTTYCHLYNKHVGVGAKVQQGQEIGTMGTTGFSTGVHLHFGVKENGKDIDPTTYFQFN